LFWHEAPPPLQITVVKLSGAGLDALGLSGALDAPAKGQNRVVRPGFVDTLEWRTGAEYRALKGTLALRAGYQYRPTPVPDQTSGTNIIDCNAHVVTAGFGVTFLMPHVFARPVTIDAAYQAQILEPRSAKKSNPNDAVGDWTATGLVHALAVGWTYHFD
jgi:long-subunit fatty acid transport protein